MLVVRNEAIVTHLSIVRYRLSILSGYDSLLQIGDWQCGTD